MQIGKFIPVQVTLCCVLALQTLATSCASNNKLYLKEDVIVKNRGNQMGFLNSWLKPNFDPRIGTEDLPEKESKIIENFGQIHLGARQVTYASMGTDHDESAIREGFIRYCESEGGYFHESNYDSFGRCNRPDRGEDLVKALFKNSSVCSIKYDNYAYNKLFGGSCTRTKDLRDDSLILSLTVYTHAQSHRSHIYYSTAETVANKAK